MQILGIDYGRSKIGVAVAYGPLAEPLKVIHFQDRLTLIEELQKIIDEVGIEKIVVGVSEGQMGEETKNFAKDLQDKLGIPVETFDETLSSKEALSYAIEAGIKRSKRQKMEDAYAATIMLQNYLDNSI